MKQHALKTEALEYELPGHLIATRPAEPRDRARMLVLSRSTDAIEHRRVSDLPDYLRSDDLLVLNNTAVAPARLLGTRLDSGGKVEGLFLEELEPGRWRMMLKSNGRLRPGQLVQFTHAADATTSAREIREIRGELIERHGAEWIVGIDPPESALKLLDEVGFTPLPPYIIKARGTRGGDDALDRRWYQTVYADQDRRGSVAAPTAGLHFTPALFEALNDKGIPHVELTLHVGPGTFKPIAVESLDQHDMHREQYEVSPATLCSLRAFQEARVADAAGRLIAIGTTTVRTLESLPDPLPEPGDEPLIDTTDLLIAPPYDFRLVDGLLTNFHLPRSTLLALVGALIGLDRLKAVYREAIAREYRFYSYGDAMLILP